MIPPTNVQQPTTPKANKSSVIGNKSKLSSPRLLQLNTMSTSDPNNGIPSMFAHSIKKKPSQGMQEKIKVYQKKEVEEKWVPNQPTMTLHGQKHEMESVELKKAPAPAPAKKEVEEEEVELNLKDLQMKKEAKPAPAPASPTKKTADTVKLKEQEAKFQKWVEEQHESLKEMDLHQVELTEEYKRQRAIAAAERRASLQEKLEDREERKKKLDEALAANKAVALGQTLLKTHHVLSPDFRRKQQEANEKLEQQRLKMEQQKKELEEKYGPMYARLEAQNRMSETMNREFEARQAEWQAQKAAEKEAARLKKEEAERKRQEYEARRAARRQAGKDGSQSPPPPELTKM